MTALSVLDIYAVLVKGTLNPDVTGGYVFVGWIEWEDEPWWKLYYHVNKPYRIAVTGFDCFIESTEGAGMYFVKGTPGIIGSYDPEPPATGIATSQIAI